MTRAQMRARLARRLHESESNPDNWVPAELNDILNDALLEVQTRLLTVAPESLLFRDTANIVAGEELVRKPDGLIYERALKLLQPDGTYVPMERITYERALQRAAGKIPDPEVMEFAPFGERYWALSPVPTANVTNGLHVDYVGTPSMSEDDDEPSIPRQLHYAVVLRAHAMAKGEAEEGIVTVLAEYESIVGRIGQWHLPTAARADRIEPGVRKRY